MSPFEYLLALVSILIGLAIADLSVSLHRLLRARRAVRWDWIPLATALIAALSILNFWWAFYQTGRLEVWTHYGSFLVLASYLISLFLLASAALPDEVPEAGLDLREYYRENHRYYWCLFAVSLAQATATMALNAYGRTTPERFAVAAGGNVVMVALCLFLARTRSRRLHAVVVPLVLLLLVAQWSRMRLR